MDKVFKENGQEIDLEPGQAVEWNNDAIEDLQHIFGNPVILNHILEQLPNSKLLELSLVSKLWKKEARIVMKKRGNLMAFLNSGGGASGCGQVFRAFAANLETLNEAMYSGMTISLSTMDDCEGTGAQEVEAIHKSILAGMKGNLKRLSIRLDHPEVCWNDGGCPNFLLLGLLLRDFIGDLEHLTLTIDRILEPFIQQLLPDGPYPKLKVLELDDSLFDLDEEAFGNLIRMLLSRAPNLQEIHTSGLVSLEENLMRGREGVVRVHVPYVDNPMRDISENAIPELRLKDMAFFYTTEPELPLEKFNEKARSLLSTCCASRLNTLELDAVSAVLLMSYGIPLLNVKDLEIEIDYDELEQFEPRILSILSRFDFTFLFPNLKKVVIRMPIGMRNLGELSRDTIDAIVEQANAVHEPTLPRNGNIKCLELLYEDCIFTSALQFLARMCPDIEEIHVNSQGEVIPVGSAWGLWAELKFIVVDGEQYQRP